MAAKSSIVPIVSKLYCSASEKILLVRRRPPVVNGGGLVVVDCGQKVAFRVDGCGILGKKEELVLRDGDGTDLLLVRRKQGIVEALRLSKRWKGYSSELDGSQKPVFSLREQSSCLTQNCPIRVSLATKDYSNYRDFEVRGDFPARDCSIIDSNGNVIAQVGVRKEVKAAMSSNDLYHVAVKRGIDQAFVFGVIAILDYIYDGSTRC